MWLKWGGRVREIVLAIRYYDIIHHAWLTYWHGAQPRAPGPACRRGVSGKHMILETGVANAVYCHGDVVSRVNLVCEYLARVKDRIVGIVQVMTPEKKPITQHIISILVCFNMEHPRLVMGMDRLLTRAVERVKRKRHGSPVYSNRQVGM